MADAVNYERDRFDIAQKVAAELGEETVPDSIWGYLDKEGLIYDAWLWGEGSTEWKKLMSAARAEKKRTRIEFGPPSNLPDRQARLATEEVAVQTGEKTEHRARAWSEIAGTLAGWNKFVREFRRKHLGAEDAVLSEEEATRRLYGNGPQAAVSKDLHDVAKELCRDWRWRMEDAYWFILTGHAPRVKPLSVTVNSNYSWVTDDFQAETAQITITAEAWVDAEHVERAYRDVQRQLLGGDNRKKKGRTLDAVIFIARQFKERGRLSWEELRKRWNESNPERTYKGRNGLQQALKHFLQPNYNELNFAPYNREPWQRQQEAAMAREYARIKELDVLYNPTERMRTKMRKDHL